MIKADLILSVVILTRNEADNIAECIKSIGGLEADHEILVVDDESTDDTVAIATGLGARVEKHALNDDFAGQRNFALTKAKGDWVFFLDADERCSQEGLQEIQDMVNRNGNANGVYFKRYDYFGNKLLIHGEIGNIRLLRMAKIQSGLWSGKVDEVWGVKGMTITAKYPLLHYSHPNITQFLKTINSRSTLNAQRLFESGKTVHWYEWGKPAAKFIQNYIFRLGFLDGLPGFVFAIFMSFHSFLVRGKLYLLIKKSETNNHGFNSKPIIYTMILWFMIVSLFYFQGAFSRLKQW